MITLEKAIEVLTSRLDAISQISIGQKFNEWKTRTLQTLSHIYGENHTAYKALEEIYSFHYTDRTFLAKDEAQELLTGLIENLENFGFNNNI